MKKITRQQLRALRVSPRIYRWFLRHFPQGAEYLAIHLALLRDGHVDWLESLVEYGYAHGFALPRFVAQETSAIQAMVEHLTRGDGGVVQIRPRRRASESAPDNAREVRFATGDDALDISCAGLQNQVALAGNGNLIGNCGENSGIANVGYACQLVSSAFAVKISNTGPNCRIGSLGGRTRISNSGNAAKISSAGRGTHIVNSGMRGYIASAGDASTIANSGDMCKLGASGDGNRITNSGDNVSIAVTGENAVVISSGQVDTLVLGKGGCAVLTYHDGVRTRFLTAYEGENGIAAGVKYRLNAAFRLEACG